MIRAGKSRVANERRVKDDRRLDGERRLVNEGAPERRERIDRRQVMQGPPERRLRIDRRDCEKGPPAGWRDRRRFAERRTPEVVEASFEEWVRLRAVVKIEQGPTVEEHEKLERMIIRS